MDTLELTDVEQIVLGMRQDGATYDQIGQTLGVSVQVAYSLAQKASYKKLFTLEGVGKFINDFNAKQEYWSLELIRKA